MGIIRYKDVPYGGGGSSVTPNPSGTATANLEKVQIESTIYSIKDSNAVHGSDKGTANGVASLDANGKVPTAQIPSLDSTYLPLAGGEMTGAINTYEPVQDIMAAIQPKTAYYGSIGASARPYRFGYFQGAVLGGSGGTGGAGAKLGTLSMYTGSGAKYAMITPDSNQSGNEVDLVLPKTSGTLALTSDIPTKTSDLTNDSGFITSNLITGVKGNAETDYRTGNVNLTPANIGAVEYCGNLTRLGSGTPAAATETFWNDKISNQAVNLACNTRGTEFSLIFSRGSNANYGSVLKWGYNDKYIYILRKNNGNWQSTDWEKISAGYADEALKASQNASGVAFGDLATINKGSGSSKFLREDGQWTTVTASWSGGTVSSDIVPSTNGTISLGSSSKYFANTYINTLYVKDNFILKSGGAGSAICSINSSVASDYNIFFPSASGVLINDTNLAATTLASFQPTAANAFQAKTLSESMDNFVYLLFEIRQYGNTLQTLLTPVSRFKGQTSSGNRVMMQYSNTYNAQIYYSSNTQVYISQSNVSSGVYYTVIYGVGRKN